MIFEKIFFYIVAIVLFVIIFLQMMRKKDNTYLVSLILQGIGILVSLICLIANININLIIKIIIYIIAIVIPIVLLVLEKKNINLTEIIYIGISKSLIFCKEEKQAKKLLLALIEKILVLHIRHN